MDDSFALTIYKQLGGREFGYVIDLKLFVPKENGLFIKFTNAKDGINSLEVILLPSDTYALTFYRTTIKGQSVKKEFDGGIYCDQLESIFREVTGLATRIPVVIFSN